MNVVDFGIFMYMQIDGWMRVRVQCPLFLSPSFIAVCHPVANPPHPPPVPLPPKHHPQSPILFPPPNTTPNIQRDIVPKDLVGQLGKAEKVLASGLDCAVDPEEENEVGKRVECR